MAVQELVEHLGIPVGLVWQRPTIYATRKELAR
jgi:hypothetical protein